jgi:hypothetical protein
MVDWPLSEKQAERGLRNMRWMLALVGLIAVALGGCATSAKYVDDSVSAQTAEIVDGTVGYWIRKQDRAALLYMDAQFCALPVVGKLRGEGFKIYAKGEPRPPRNSWDTDESVSWVELDVGEIEKNGDDAKARVKTSWRGGVLVEEYLLSRRDGKWFVVRTEMVAVP